MPLSLTTAGLHSGLPQRAHKEVVDSVGPLLDLTLWASDEGFVEASLAMLLVQELLDSQTIAMSERSFVLLEERAERIAALCRMPEKKSRSFKVSSLLTLCFLDSALTATNSCYYFA